MAFFKIALESMSTYMLSLALSITYGKLKIRCQPGNGRPNQKIHRITQKRDQTQKALKKRR